MTLWLTAGVLFTLLCVLFTLYRWGNVLCIGVTPVRHLSFLAILFTSGLDVGLIMFPLTEFSTYADVVNNPEYAFTNPVAIEFGFWGFLVWALYFLTCFYFCVIEPKIQFFAIPFVKLLNNIIVIGTCAFTASLFLSNLPWYLPSIGDGETVLPVFYCLVFFVIVCAVHSSSNLRYVRFLSLGSTLSFVALMAYMAALHILNNADGAVTLLVSLGFVLDYFPNLGHFILPINAYHEFYLYWWFAWSIMIGQFTARFVGGFKTWQLFLAMLSVPSLLIAAWFAVLYVYHIHAIELTGITTSLMVGVGTLFVINSLDSLVRLYSDNLGITVKRFGYRTYMIINLVSLSVLTLMFQMDFLQIQWVGAIVVALFFSCFTYILVFHQQAVLRITRSPEENRLDYDKLSKAN